MNKLNMQSPIVQAAIGDPADPVEGHLGLLECYAALCAVTRLEQQRLEADSKLYASWYKTDPEGLFERLGIRWWPRLEQAIVACPECRSNFTVPANYQAQLRSLLQALTPPGLDEVWDFVVEDFWQLEQRVDKMEAYGMSAPELGYSVHFLFAAVRSIRRIDERHNSRLIMPLIRARAEVLFSLRREQHELPVTDYFKAVLISLIHTKLDGGSIVDRVDSNRQRTRPRPSQGRNKQRPGASGQEAIHPTNHSAK